LRVIRVYRLLHKAERIKIILLTLLNSLGSLGNAGGLLLLVMFVYSVIGVTLFATVKIAEPLNVDIVNFQTFLNVFLILYRAICGENWHLIMDAIGRPRTLSFQCESDFSFSAYQETGVPG